MIPGLTVGRVALAAGLAAAAALLLFVHPPSDRAPDRIQLTLWRVTGAEEAEPAVPEWFNESQERIQVRPVGLPFAEIEQKFLTAVVGNIAPDLYEFFGAVAQWSTRGALLPLDEFMARDHFDRSAIFPAVWDEMMWNGKTYAIPTGCGDEAFFWNRKHFREAGLDPDRPPETWDDLTTYALRLTTYAADGSIDRAGYVPGYWSAFPMPIFLDWPVQKGARFLSADGTKVTLATTAGIEALQWEADLFKKMGRDALIHKRASFGYGTQHGFLGGQVSMIVQKSSFVQEITKFAPQLDYGCALLPYPRGGRRACIAGCVWIAIPTGCKDPEAAWEYIKYYTTTAVQIRSAEYAVQQKLSAFFPANIEAAHSPVVLSQPHMDVFLESMQFGQSSTVIPLAHTVFWRAYSDAWDRAMRGAQTPREALVQAEKEAQRALDDQIGYSVFYERYLKDHAPRPTMQKESAADGSP